MNFAVDLTDLVARIKSDLRAELLAELRTDLDREAWPGWMDVPTAAKYLGISVERVRKLVAHREIPFSQAGRGCRVFFERVELDRWMRNQGVVSTTAA